MLKIHSNNIKLREERLGRYGSSHSQSLNTMTGAMSSSSSSSGSSGGSAINTSGGVMASNLMYQATQNYAMFTTPAVTTLPAVSVLPPPPPPTSSSSSRQDTNPYVSNMSPSAVPAALTTSTGVNELRRRNNVNVPGGPGPAGVALYDQHQHAQYQYTPNPYSYQQQQPVQQTHGSQQQVYKSKQSHFTAESLKSTQKVEAAINQLGRLNYLHICISCRDYICMNVYMHVLLLSMGFYYYLFVSHVINK